MLVRADADVAEKACFSQAGAEAAASRNATAGTRGVRRSLGIQTRRQALAPVPREIGFSPGGIQFHIIAGEQRGLVLAVVALLRECGVGAIELAFGVGVAFFVAQAHRNPSPR